tara:strand:- start:12706 stop:13128 length:423 start_codon:yes stop_codon:yes gene_type:complete
MSIFAVTKMTNKLKKTKMTKEILNYATEGINNLISAESEPYACDLHHELFNTDYFIIGKYDATRWLESNVGVFQAIEEVKEYEQDNFGEVSTDLSSPEAVCNMYVYIQGEELLNESKTLMNNWNENLTKETLEQILTELK